MNVTTESRPAAGPWLGAAGCAITFLLAILGTVVGGWIGWLTSPPEPPHTNEYSGLRELFETIYRVSGGLICGGLLGIVLGIVIAIVLIRRGKRRT